MAFNHVVAWIDHEQAHLMHFNIETSLGEVIKNHAPHAGRHPKGGMDSGRDTADASYFEAVATALAPSREILIVGPGMEKLALMKHLIAHHHDVAARVMSVETVDHPSDGQLLKYARKYFVKADSML